MYRQTLADGQPPARGAAVFGICFLRVALSGVLFGMSAYAIAVPIQPFRSQNLNPFLIGSGMPSAETPFLGGGEALTAFAQVDVVNNSISREQNAESVVIDGETYRAMLGLRKMAAERVELGIDVPWIAHSPGFMDEFIEEWHNAFGLSNSERDFLGAGQLRYGYARESVALADVDQRVAGLGDIQLGVAWQFLKRANTAATVRATLDLATGDAEKLTGSGGTEAAVAVALGDRTFLSAPSMSAMLSAGILRAGGGSVLQPLQKDWVGFGSVALGWDVSASLTMKGQVDFHTPMYATALRPIGGAGVQLTLGAAVAISHRLLLDLAIGENLHTGATPDVVFHFALGYRGD